MIDKQKIETYNNLNHWQNFRLRLVGEGILVGLFSGCIVGFFRYVLNYADVWREMLYDFLGTVSVIYVSGVVALFLLLAFILSRLVAYEPLSAGSGIPQVKGNILGLYKTVWWRIIWSKLLGGILGIGAGLSLGREGPAIQLGAMAGQGFSRFLGRTRMEERYLISSGAGAGLAAAFNAPLAGVIFTLEELHKNFSVVVLLPSLAAALTSTIISRIFFGHDTIFLFPDLSRFPVQYLPYLALLGACLGLLGAFFNYCLVKSSDFYKLPFFKNNFMRIALPLMLAIPLGFYLPQVLGGGNKLVDSLVTMHFSLQLLLVFLVCKFAFTMLSYGCGVPGGFFLPMLVVGALSGNILGSVLVNLGLVAPYYRTHVIIFAMAGFFSASVRAPITGIILIMEMTASFKHLVPLAIVAVFSYVVAELCHSKPIYDSLLQKALIKDKTDMCNMEKGCTRNVIELSVESGSFIEGKMIKNVPWPEHTLLVDVKRGDEDIVPSGNTRIVAGDYLYVLTDTANCQRVRELLEK
ncbi:MAG: ClC family H(+)/Cl(-) exchange transporter [Acidaminococcaceae bacterium]|nr:ClC family H(+)/Cl(-) exchange transporter [Acidaminococcaceae bacterium]